MQFLLFEFQFFFGSGIQISLINAQAISEMHKHTVVSLPFNRPIR
jgi:hypothetical protein